jgi:RimJ/RimL family protein N-acetyltransferase
MNHSVTTEGFGVRLRPVRAEDAPFIVWLRNLDHARGRIGDTVDEAGQRAWLEKYFAREGDYYFVIETAGGIAVGAYGIYEVRGKSAESGRWVIRTDVPAAIPSAMLAFQTAFETLALEELRVSTVATNHLVLSLNKKFGFRQTGITPNAQVINGRPVDLVHFLLDAKDWPKVFDKLGPLAKLAEAQVREWEQSQKEK